MRKGSSSILGAVLLAVGIGLVGFTAYQWFADPGEVALPPAAKEADLGMASTLPWQPSPLDSPEPVLPGATLGTETVPADPSLPTPMPSTIANAPQDLPSATENMNPTATMPTAISLLDPPAPMPTPTPALQTDFTLSSHTQPTNPNTHTVAAGDTLGSIAKQYLGKESRWTEIAQRNPTVDPLRLRIGQVIQLPPQAVQEITPGTAASSSDPPSELIIPAHAKTHIVREGDTFWTLAQEHYDNGALWQTIYRANRQIVGNNPDRLSTGMKLIIPPPPVE